MKDDMSRVVEALALLTITYHAPMESAPSNHLPYELLKCFILFSILPRLPKISVNIASGLPSLVLEEVEMSALLNLGQ